VVGTLTARIDKPNPRYFIGTGKAEELKAAKLANEADLILVNQALTPVQERNLEKFTECRVIDRTGLILDIFAQRARSHEGKLQVELAQLKHMGARAVRGWSHLDSQRGGAIGLRGPGETQLEIDRRLIAGKVKVLEERLEKVNVQRETSRRARVRNALPLVSLVGYTNAGKSTLFNKLTGSEVFAADLLFATLDPTLRRIEGLPCGPIVLADTVGFIRDLPHDLIAAFKSTLAETRDADLLVHMVDASDPEREQRMADVAEVLKEIGAEDIPQVVVFNKIDRLEEGRPRLEAIDGGETPRVWLSAAQGIGLDLLGTAIADSLGRERVQRELRLPADKARLRARLFAAGVLVGENQDEEGWLVRLDAPMSRLEPLFGLPDGDGSWFKRALKLKSAGAT